MKVKTSTNYLVACEERWVASAGRLASEGDVLTGKLLAPPAAVSLHLPVEHGRFEICMRRWRTAPALRKGTLTVNIVKLPQHPFQQKQENVHRCAGSLAANGPTESPWGPMNIEIEVIHGGRVGLKEKHGTEAS